MNNAGCRSTTVPKIVLTALLTCLFCSAARAQTSASRSGGKTQANPPAQIVTKTVAFSFSNRCLHDGCGDGAWGGAVNNDTQGAINAASSLCSANTKRGWCSFGGRFFVRCSTAGGEKWAALAILDDGYENLWHGEGIGFDSEDAAQRSAVSTCGHDGCHIVWSREVCGVGPDQALGECTARFDNQVTVTRAAGDLPGYWSYRFVNSGNTDLKVHYYVKGSDYPEQDWKGPYRVTVPAGGQKNAAGCVARAAVPCTNVVFASAAFSASAPDSCGSTVNWQQKGVVR
jgi:hypothetical protein